MSEKALLFVISRLEQKLKQYMELEEFKEFIKDVTREAFRMDVEALEDGGFKDYILANFDWITEARTEGRDETD